MTLPRLLEADTFATWLRDAEGAPAQVDAPPFLILDLGSADNYAMGHIPSAVRVDPSEIVDGGRPAVGKLPGLARLQALCNRIGLRPDSQVVVYDDEGGGWAGRMIWTLEMVGHIHWYYLNGGIHAWRALALPQQTTAVATKPSNYPVQIHPGPRVTVDELLARQGDPELCIWDARSAAEFRGERSGSERFGHIPGATNLDWLALMDPSRALRLREDLPALLASHGITAGRDVVTHCQTHHRSGLTYLVGRLLEFPRIRAYDGSWSEWGNRADTPISTTS